VIGALSFLFALAARDGAPVNFVFFATALIP